MIKGDAEVIAASKNARAGDPANLVNWDALNFLPDLYDGQVVRVNFQPPKSDKDPGDFSPVGGGMYMPSVDLMNRIADARGISGLDMAIPEPIMAEIDWNRMVCNFADPPRLVRYLVGYSITKQGRVLTEDGTERVSDPCTVSYNAWERVCELFGKEEQYTDYYAKCQRAQNGALWYPGYEGKQTFCKYDTRAKRQAALDAELKFAERKADTKARNVVIRVLCGMQTGYTVADLKTGYFTFYKIMRSSFAIKSEHAARLNAMAHGENASASLYGPGRKCIAEAAPVDYATPQHDATSPADNTPADLAESALADTPRVLTRQLVINAFSSYLQADIITADKKDACSALVNWLLATENPEAQDIYWNKTIALLDEVESKIPEELRCKE
jgi:hypothetical protein